MNDLTDVRQNPPKSHAGCNLTAIRQAARHMTRFYDACFAEVGLRGAQYTILTYLWRSGPLTMNGLADAMVMDRTTVGHNMKPLERDGLVSVEVDPEDRRSRLISLTPQGREKVRDGEAAWIKAQRVFEAKFGGTNAREMRKIMRAVVAVELLPQD